MLALETKQSGGKLLPRSDLRGGGGKGGVLGGNPGRGAKGGEKREGGERY